jgi:hypothetical protein
MFNRSIVFIILSLSIMMSVLVPLSNAENMFPNTTLPMIITVNSTIYLNSSYNGNGLVTYKHGVGLGDYPILILTGTGNTLSGVNFDDSDSSLGYVNGAVFVEGTNNTIQFCTLDNCIRYGFCTDGAKNFKIVNNTVYKAQYGISGSTGTAPNGTFSENGLVADNKISGMILVGIKMKLWENVIVRNNEIDVFEKNPSFVEGGETHNKVGIDFVHGDAPTINVTIEHNHIYMSQPHTVMAYSVGVFGSEDVHAVLPDVRSSGMVIRYNLIEDCEYAVWIKDTGYSVYNNTIVRSRYGIVATATINTIEPPSVVNSSSADFTENCNTYNSTLWNFEGVPPSVNSGTWVFDFPANTAKTCIAYSMINQHYWGYGTYELNFKMSGHKPDSQRYYLYLIMNVPDPNYKEIDMFEKNYSEQRESWSVYKYGYDAYNYYTSSINYEDGAYHTWRCDYTATYVKFYIDDVLQDSYIPVVGAISEPPMELLFGGHSCGDTTYGTNYAFTMTVDWFKYTGIGTQITQITTQTTQTTTQTTTQIDTQPKGSGITNNKLGGNSTTEGSGTVAQQESKGGIVAPQEVKDGFVDSAKMIMDVLPIMAVFIGVGLVKSGKFDTGTVIGYAIMSVVIIIVSSIFI